MIIDAIDDIGNNSEYSEFELEFNALVIKHFPHWNATDITKL
jgi:sulfate adenylyltransferase subunit 1